jgi:hypothetical protein
MSTLILGDSDKDVIKALARKYAKGQGSWGADHMQGKGAGQIFLLHGKYSVLPVSETSTDFLA